MMDVIDALVAAATAHPWALIVALVVLFALGLLFWDYIRIAAPRLLPLALTLTIASVWAAALLGLADRRPQGQILRDIEVHPSEDRLTLGAHELMQVPGLPGSADARHVLFERRTGTSGAGQVWSVANVSKQRKLLLIYADADNNEVAFLSDRVPLEPGDVLKFPDAPGNPPNMRFEQVDAGSITFQIASAGADKPARTFEISTSDNGASFQFVQGGPGPCPGAAVGWATELVARARGLFATAPKETTVAYFGGPATCRVDRTVAIALANQEFAALKLQYIGGLGFALARNHAESAWIERAGKGRIWLNAVQNELRDRLLGGRKTSLVKFVAGRSTYRIVHGGSRTGGARAEQDTPCAADLGLAFCILPDAAPHRLAFDGSCGLDKLAIHAGPMLPWHMHCDDAPKLTTEWREPLRAPFTAIATLAGSLASSVWERFKSHGLAHGLASIGAAAASVAAVFAAWRWTSFVGAARLFGPESGAERGLRLAAAALGAAIALAFLAAWKYPAAGQAGHLAPFAPWLSIALWCFAAAALACARGAGFWDGSIFSAWTALIAVGHTGLTAFSLASPELRHLRFSDDTTLAIGAAAGLVVAASQLDPLALASMARSLSMRHYDRMSNLPRGLVVVLAFIGALILAWMALGSETGIAGAFQPSEIVKTLSILVLAAALTLALDPDRGRVLARWSSRPRGGLDPLLKAFFFVDALFLLLLLAPIVRSDFSPIIVLVLTSGVTLLLVAATHLVAKGSDYFFIARELRAAPPNLARPPSPARPWLERQRGRLTRLLGHPFVVLARAEVWHALGLALCIGGVVLFGKGVLDQAAPERLAWIARYGGFPDKPLDRLVSWIEFNGREPAPGLGQGLGQGLGKGQSREKGLDVEFADVGHQVARSRLIVTASSCAGFAAAIAGPIEPNAREAAGKIEPTLLDEGAVAALAARGRDAAARATDRLAQWFLPTCKSGAQDAHWAQHAILRLPEAHNDFIGASLTAFFGRDGAVAIAALQLLFIALTLVAAFLVFRWTPGNAPRRPVASTAAYAAIGFSSMLGAQWLISWLNATGFLPVMGQPASFLSHGLSHLLLFGAPAALAPILALRIRAAQENPFRRDAIPAPPWWCRRFGGRRLKLPFA